MSAAAQRAVDEADEHVTLTEPLGYHAVDSTAVLNLRIGLPNFAYGLKLNEAHCAVCAAFVGPTSSDDVYEWVPCYMGPAGVICEPCCADIDPVAFLV